MLDLRFIRTNSETVKKAVRDKGEKVDIDHLLELDKMRRETVSELDRLRAERNKISSLIGKLIREDPQKAEGVKREARVLSDKVKALEEREKQIDQDLQSFLIWVPNIPTKDVPIGSSEDDNVVVREWGEHRQFDFEPKDHLELGTKLELFDFNRASKIAGAFFPLYKGLGALLERALINFMLDVHIKEHGYVELFPPFLANSEAMFATGQIPKLREDMYYIPENDYFLIPTGEVPLTNYHQNEVLQEDELPLKYTAYTPCFRREAGSYGKETKGLIRVHQFNKVELVNFVLPEESEKALETLTSQAEKVLQLLGIPYRVVLLCTGELSFAGARCYDLEVWSPAEGKYLETSSCTNFLDFQARRGNIRLRRKDGRMEYPHTLNGSGVATSRLLVALLENYQTRDGKVTIPEILRPYLGGISEIK